MGSWALPESAGLRIRSLADHSATASSDSRASNEKGSRPITSTWQRVINTGSPVATRMVRTPCTQRPPRLTTTSGGNIGRKFATSPRTVTSQSSRSQASTPDRRLPGGCGILVLRAMSVAQAVRVDPRMDAVLREYAGHPYKKWQGAHWRLLSLVELGLTDADDRIVEAVNLVLQWLLGPERKTLQISGRYRQHASMDGNGLLVCCRLGMQSDPRVVALATRLTQWQWPDGGWNCDRRPNVTHSSFHESLPPLRGLAAYGGFPEATARAAEFFLRHRMFRSESDGTGTDPGGLPPHSPPY